MKKNLADPSKKKILKKKIFFIKFFFPIHYSGKLPFRFTYKSNKTQLKIWPTQAGITKNLIFLLKMSFNEIQGLFMKNQEKMNPYFKNLADIKLKIIILRKLEKIKHLLIVRVECDNCIQRF